MSMSRKNYVETAKIIKWEMDHLPDDDYGRIVTRDTLRRVASELASMFQRDNGSFDRQRFLDACGL